MADRSHLAYRGRHPDQCRRCNHLTLSSLCFAVPGNGPPSTVRDGGKREDQPARERGHATRCLVSAVFHPIYRKRETHKVLSPTVDDAILSMEWKESYGASSSWQRHDHARRQSCNTTIARFARADEPGVGHQSQDGCEVAHARRPRIRRPGRLRHPAPLCFVTLRHREGPLYIKPDHSMEADQS